MSILQMRKLDLGRYVICPGMLSGKVGLDESEHIGCLLRGVFLPRETPSSCKTLDLEGGVIHQGCNPLSTHKTPGRGEGG